MTYSATAARILAIITILTVFLIGVEYAAYALLGALHGVAATRRFLLFFLTSFMVVSARCLFWRDDTEYLEGDSDDYLENDDDDTSGSESEVGSFRPPPPPPGHVELSHWSASRSKAPSPSLRSHSASSTSKHAASPPVPPTSAPSRSPPRISPPRTHAAALSYSTPGPVYTTSQSFAMNIPQPACFIPPQYTFAPRSVLLSGYVQQLHKRSSAPPYVYTPSSSNRRHRHTSDPFLHALDEDERFPVASGLVFPDALPVEAFLSLHEVSTPAPASRSGRAQPNSERARVIPAPVASPRISFEYSTRAGDAANGGARSIPISNPPPSSGPIPIPVPTTANAATPHTRAHSASFSPAMAPSPPMPWAHMFAHPGTPAPTTTALRNVQAPTVPSQPQNATPGGGLASPPRVTRPRRARGGKYGAKRQN